MSPMCLASRFNFSFSVGVPLVPRTRTPQRRQQRPVQPPPPGPSHRRPPRRSARRPPPHPAAFLRTHADAPHFRTLRTMRRPAPRPRSSEREFRSLPERPQPAHPCSLATVRPSCFLLRRGPAARRCLSTAAPASCGSIPCLLPYIVPPSPHPPQHSVHSAV